MAAKQPVSFSARPSTIDKADKLARQLGISRSELICRVLNIVADELQSPMTGTIQLEKKHLQQLLTV